MKRLLIFVFTTILLSDPCAQQLDTRTNITNFFNLSRNYFEINAKSKILDEQKAYASLKEADIDGGVPDGKITYSEYLTYLNKTTPNSISSYDFTLSKILPSLKGFTFLDDATFLASGITSNPINVQDGFIIPAGAKVSLFKFPGFRVNAKTDFVVNGATARSGADTPFEVYFVENRGFFPGQFQIAKDAVIEGIPCRGAHIDVWDVNISLFLTGQVNRAILSGEYSANEITFFADEKIQCDSTGKVDAAVLLQNRTIQGHAVVAVTPQGVDPRTKGLWGGGTPNIFFENGLLKMCYENNKVVEGVSIPGTAAYFYDTSGVVTGLSPQNTFFLGYPVLMKVAKPGWDWGIPQPTILIANGLATFTADVSIQIEAGSKKVVLPEGAIVTVDMATGFCLVVKLPNGASLAYTVQDKMRPIPIAVAKQSAQMLRWAEQWLTAHPEAKDGSNKEIRQAHIQLRDQLLVLEKQAAQEAIYTKCIEVALLYKDKSKGLVSGNSAFDLNCDGRIQDAELVPDSILEAGATSFSPEDILEYLIENGVDRLPIARLQDMGKVMSEWPIFDPRKDSLGSFDLLGSVLSKKGIHPFSSRRIYYFPNCSGDKVICDSIGFYKSTGSPMSLTVDVFSPTTNSDFSIFFSLPGVEGKVHAFLYDNAQVQESIAHKNDAKTYWLSKGKDPEYWSSLNTITFHESGALASYRGIPFFENFSKINLPSNVSVNGSENGYPPMPNIAEWTPDGRLTAMSEPNGFFDLPGGITVNSPRWIRWLDNVPYGRISVACDASRLTNLTIKKGTYTLYKFADGKWISYTKTFAKDTTFATQGFMLNDEGVVTAYW